MSDEKVSILVEAIDKASGVLGSVGGALKTLGGIAGGVALGGVAAFFGAVASGVGDAKATALVTAQTEQVIKSMGNSAGVSAQHVADLASSLSDAAGKSLFGDDQIQASANMLLTFGNIKGETLDLATALTVDMGQALKKTPEDMSVMVGKLLNSSDAMSAAQRMGVSFTDQQLKLGKAMFESGNIAGYQKMVLEELNKEFGGQAAAAAAATGGWSEFTGRLGEAKETLGAAVLPLLNGLVGVLNDRLMPVIEAGAVAFGHLVQLFSDKLAPLLSVLWKAGDLSAGGWARLGGVLRDMFGSTLGGLFTEVARGISAIHNAVVDILPAFNLLGILLKNGDLSVGGWARLSGVLGPELSGAIHRAADAIGQLFAIWADGSEVTSSFTEQVGYLLDTLMGVGEDTVGPLQAFGAAISETLNTISESWAIAGDFTSSFAEQFGATIDLMTGADGTFQVIGAAIADLASGVQAAFSDGGIGGAFQFLADKLAEVSPGFAILKGIVEAALPPIQDIVTSVFGIITGFIQEHGATMLADVTSVWNSIQALIDAVLPPIRAIVGAVFGAIATFLHTHGDDIKTFLAATWDQIASIIKIAVELVKAIIVPVFTFVAGFLNDHSSEIQTILGSAWDAIKALIDGALTLIKGILTVALQVIKGDWSGAWETIKTTLGRVWDDIKTIISSAWDVIKTLFGGFAADAVSMGAGIVNSVVDGIKGAAHKLADIIGNAVGDAIDAGKDALHNAGVPGFASGVRNFAGGLALVGERGPELVALPSGSNVYSNSESRSMLAGAGAGTTINVYFNAGAIVGAAGQNVEQLADRVIERMQSRIGSRRTA